MVVCGVRGAEMGGGCSAQRSAVLHDVVPEEQQEDAAGAQRREGPAQHQLDPGHRLREGDVQGRCEEGLCALRHGLSETMAQALDDGAVPSQYMAGVAAAAVDDAAAAVWLFFWANRSWYLNARISIRNFMLPAGDVKSSSDQHDVWHVIA
eukprot:462785-Rhodomonas_salina.1